MLYLFERQLSSVPVPVLHNFFLDEAGHYLESASNPVEPFSAENFSPADHSVLVVDDDEDQLLLCGLFMRRAGYTVLSASSGMEALQILSQVSVSAVVSDVNMPGMSGFELLRALRSDPNLELVPVIMQSAGGDQLEMELLKAGADMYCPKGQKNMLLFQLYYLLE